MFDSLLTPDVMPHRWSLGAAAYALLGGYNYIYSVEFQPTAFYVLYGGSTNARQKLLNNGSAAWTYSMPTSNCSMRMYNNGQLMCGGARLFGGPQLAPIIFEVSPSTGANLSTLYSPNWGSGAVVNAGRAAFDPINAYMWLPVYWSTAREALMTGIDNGAPNYWNMRSNIAGAGNELIKGAANGLATYSVWANSVNEIGTYSGSGASFSGSSTVSVGTTVLAITTASPDSNDFLILTSSTSTSFKISRYSLLARTSVSGTTLALPEACNTTYNEMQYDATGITVILSIVAGGSFVIRLTTGYALVWAIKVDGTSGSNNMRCIDENGIFLAVGGQIASVAALLVLKKAVAPVASTNGSLVITSANVTSSGSGLGSLSAGTAFPNLTGTTFKYPRTDTDAPTSVSPLTKYTL